MTSISLPAMVPTEIRLSDKYELLAGRVFMTGTQALVRMLLAQKARDATAGLRTEGFVSGYTAERRDERAAIGEFEHLARQIEGEVDADHLPLALELARLPQSVRGFGHVWERNAKAAALKQEELLVRWHQPQTTVKRMVA